MSKSNEIHGKIYLDHASATHVDDRVFQVMQKIAKENLGLEDVGIVVDRDKILVNDFYQTNILKNNA